MGNTIRSITSHPVKIPAGENSAVVEIAGDSVTVLETNCVFDLVFENIAHVQCDRAGRIEIITPDGGTLLFKSVTVKRRPEFTGEINVVLQIGLGIRYTDGRTQVTANITTPPVLPVLSAPAPLQWRTVPHIRHELLSVAGVPTHVWTEEPRRGSVYGSEAAYEAFMQGTSQCACVALANPRVTKRRITLLSASNTNQMSPDDNYSGSIMNGSVFISSNPKDFDSNGGSATGLARTLQAFEPLEIEGGSPIFAATSAGMMAGLMAFRFVVEEWFYPEEIALPAAFSNWPGSGTPAQWGKMTAPAAIVSGNLVFIPTPPPPETTPPEETTPPPDGDTTPPPGTPVGDDDEFDLYFDESADGDEPSYHRETDSQTVYSTTGASISFSVTSTTRPLVALVVNGEQYPTGTSGDLPPGTYNISVIYEGPPTTTGEGGGESPQAVVHVDAGH